MSGQPTPPCVVLCLVHLDLVSRVTTITMPYVITAATTTMLPRVQTGPFISVICTVAALYTFWEHWPALPLWLVL
jgi:hypothetical protein